MAGSAQPLRLVLDTNVVGAGLLWNGPPRRLIEWAIEGEAVEPAERHSSSAACAPAVCRADGGSSRGLPRGLGSRRTPVICSIFA